MNGLKPVAMFTCLAWTVFASQLAMAQAGPQTTIVDIDGYRHVYYVSAETGSDERGRGSRRAPWASIAHALRSAKAPDAAVLVAAGEYSEHSLALRAGVDLYGGYDEDWARDVVRNRSVINANGQGRVVAAAADARLDGFELTGGRIRGAGAAVYIDGGSPVLSNNFFFDNQTLGPENWNPEYWHETAHDGGAVYCSNGGGPIVLGNAFAGNRTENGRGGGLAYDGRCGGEITANVFLNNTAGLDDPMRSSDGGALSIFRWSSPLIADNIVLNNEARSKNDGGGIFVALWSSPRIEGNLIVNNEAGDDAGGLFVGGQEHRYDAPLDPLPEESAFYVRITDNRFFGNRNSSRNSGAARITMESRGRISGNTLALNEGFYIQRSEVEVVDNTILENVLFIETKEGLKASRFHGNIVGGAFDFDTLATVEDSLFRDGFTGNGNLEGEAALIDDGKTLAIVSSAYSPATLKTTLRVAAPPAADSVRNRVIVSGRRWGVVDSIDGQVMSVWGDLSGVSQAQLLPTYRQTPASPGWGKGADAARAEAGDWQPARINKSIELLENGQAIYYAAGYGGYAQGLAMAATWADYIVYNMEHQPPDFAQLREFMRGLVDAGPTPSGHRTPAVIVVLPLLGLDGYTVRSGGWMVQQALAQGVHGVHLARARDPEAVRRFVQAARYPIHKQALDELGEGLRGWGSQNFAAWVWGLSSREYLQRADVWPLNPDGEIMLGVKLEDRQAIANTEETLAVPGIAFAEHGPRDLGLSFGYLDGRADPPLPDEVNAAGDRVLEAARSNGLFFLDNVLPDNVRGQLDRGVMIGAGRREDAAEIGREHTGRRMPW
ncbi:MAG: aldolase/citrate lyase family protein [Pseudomonadota bacterium]